MKHEKYIHERKTKKGNPYLEIHIDYKSKGKKKAFVKTINIADYASPAQAMKAAVLIRNKAIIEVEEETITSEYPTIKELYEQKFDLIKCSIKTKERHQSVYDHSIIDIEELPINKVTTAILQKNINDYAEKHSQDMVKRLVSIWRQIYQVVAMLELPIPDKSRAIVIPKVSAPVKKRDVIISDADFEKFMEALIQYNDFSYNSLQIWRMLRIMYYTGMRPAEALALTKEDVHENYITVNKSVGSTSSEKMQIVRTKTSQSVRDVPIHKALKPIIDDIVKNARYDLLLADVNGNPYDIDKVASYISAVSVKSKIKFNSYMMRHGVADRLVHAGIDQRTAQDVLGHASYNMTLYYARSSMEDRKKAIETMA